MEMNNNNNITMNAAIMGGCINQELINYLDYATSIFRKSDEVNARHQQLERNYKAAETSFKGINSKWNIITIVSSMITLMFIGSLAHGVLKIILDIILVAGVIVGTQYLKRRFVPSETVKKRSKLQTAASELEVSFNQKQQLDAYVAQYYSNIPETYRTADGFDYMLKLARAGRIMNLNQGYQCLDEEALRQEMPQQQKDAYNAQKNAATGAVAAAGAMGVIGGAFRLYRFVSKWY